MLAAVDGVVEAEAETGVNVVFFDGGTEVEGSGVLVTDDVLVVVVGEVVVGTVPLVVLALRADRQTGQTKCNT